jgi:hypothetical protein
MSCPFKYKLNFLDSLVPREGLSIWIRRGVIIHNALLEYWKVRLVADDYQEAVKKCLNRAKEDFAKDLEFEPDFKLESLQTLLQFLQHIQSYSWIPLAAEKHFRKLVYEDATLRLRIFLTGRIDLIVRTPQLPVIPIDLKTETERWFHSQMSNQFRIYCIATDTNLLWVQRVGFQKTLKPEDKFAIESIPFDPDILDEWKNNTLVYWVKQLIVAHEDSYFPMNTTNCIHGHFKCQFSDGNEHRGICNVSRVIRQQKLERYFVKTERWDPSKT